MSLKNCYNFDDFRKLAKKKLPAPIFHYIDGGSDDEVTLNRNTEAFNDCDLVPNILNSVGEPDLKTNVFGTTINVSTTLSFRIFDFSSVEDTTKLILSLFFSLDNK